MAYIIVGKPTITDCGTKIYKYFEEGILHRSYDFRESTNKLAKQQGLAERVFKYDSQKRPLEYTDIYERKIVLPIRENLPKYYQNPNMGFKRFGDKTTKCGTRSFKYIENGILYKRILYNESTNKIAKQQGLVETEVKYGKNLKPLEITSTYKRKTIVPVKEKLTTISAPVNKTNTEAEEADYFGTLGADSKDSFYEAYRKTDRRSVLYQDYDLFIDKVRTNIEKFKTLLPDKLYKDIINKYGTEEMSIRKIIQDNDFDIDKVSIMPHQESLKTKYKIFITNTEKKEQQFASIRLANKSEKLSVAYTNAWTNSNLRFDMGIRLIKWNGSPWSIIKDVWSKILNPDASEYQTDKLIDSFLIHMFKNRYQNRIFSYNGKNPLSKYTEDKEMTKMKILALKTMYRGVKNLESEEDRKILKNPIFKEYKKSADVKAMAETIEQFEEHYKNAFLKYFWTDERKLIFSEVLKNEIKELGEKIDLSNDIFEALIRNAIIN